MPIDQQGDPKEYLESLVNTLDPGMRNLFAYRMSRSIVCHNCRAENRLNDEELHCVNLPKDVTNVQEALEDFFLPEDMDMMVCQVCSGMSVTLEKVINYYPPILVVHNLDGKAIVLNLNITMGTQVYSLLNFNLMKGSSRHRHYTAVRTYQNEVKEFDDERVRKFNFIEQKKKRVYVAFYVKEDSDCATDLRTKIHSPDRASNEAGTSGEKEATTSKQVPKGQDIPNPSEEKPVKTEPTEENENVPNPSEDDKINIDSGDKNEDDGNPSEKENLNLDDGEKKDEATESQNIEDLDDTINYEITVDNQGVPIIGTLTIIVTDENGNQKTLHSEEEYMEYLGAKAKEIKESVPKKPKSPEVEDKIREKFKDTIKKLTVNLFSDVVDRYVNQKKEEKKKPRGRPKGTKSDTSKPKNPKVSSKSFRTTGIGNKAKTQDPKKKIEALVKSYKKKVIKMPTQDRKKYTYRQWDKKGLNKGKLHKSFILQSASNVLPREQPSSRGPEGIGCILCYPRFLARSPENLIEHYNRIHYNRIYYVRKLVKKPIIMLRCKCEDVLSRCDVNRNVHHHCPICWRPMDKIFDILKHMTSGKKGHDWTDKDIVEK